jgi:hypothetical protein
MTLKSFEVCTLNLHIPLKKKKDLIKNVAKTNGGDNVYGKTSLLVFID